MQKEQCIFQRFFSLDVIKNITDPEKPQTLEDLDIINENDVTIKVTSTCCIIRIYLTPTVPHCSLATLIGNTLCFFNALLIIDKIDAYFYSKI